MGTGSEMGRATSHDCGSIKFNVRVIFPYSGSEYLFRKRPADFSGLADST